MTARPCGQKKRRSEMIQSQTVTPPLVAIEGTTFRLNTATTKRRTRSQRPRTRLSWGASVALAEENVVACVDKNQTPRFVEPTGAQKARFAQDDKTGIHKNLALPTHSSGPPEPFASLGVKKARQDPAPIKPKGAAQENNRPPL